MPADGQNTLIAPTNGAATINGSSWYLPAGTPARALDVRFVYNGASAATAGATLQPVIQRATDGTAWVDYVLGGTVTLGTAATAYEEFVRFVTTPTFPYVRAVSRLTGTGSPTYSVQADHVWSRP